MAISKPEVLHDKHLLEQFDCGNPSLNEWLLRHARQAQSSGSAKNFVISDDNIVIGYFSLTVGQARIQIISATVMDWRRGEASC